jgi:hypothetical protein
MLTLPMRVTETICGVSQKRLPVIMHVFGEFPTIFPSFWTSRCSETMFRNVENLTLETDIGAIDLMAVPAGVESYEGLYERATEMDLGDSLSVSLRLMI